MAKSWSFPTSPRNPAKIPIELSILSNLVDTWKEQGKKWKPETTELEFGETLRASGEVEDNDAKQNLYFKRQADTITEQNLKWTGRARFGTFKFLGFVYVTNEGYADLTDAGRRIITTKQPSIIMLKQLLKWQYPDNQHRGKKYPEETFRIWPFVAVAQLIKELGGLTKNEIALFCFTMQTMKDLAKVRKVIADFRVTYANEKGKIPKRRLVSTLRRSMKERAQEQGDKIPIDSFRDYADALGRYMRYTGLFSIDGNRIVITKGRETEVEDLLKLDLKLHPYDDPDTFYSYYGNPELPTLPTDVDPSILHNQINSLVSDLSALHAELNVLKYGIVRESTSPISQTLTEDIEKLRTYSTTFAKRKRK